MPTLGPEGDEVLHDLPLPMPTPSPATQTSMQITLKPEEEQDEVSYDLPLPIPQPTRSSMRITSKFELIEDMWLSIFP